jgi:hypothetical protein
MVFLYWITFFLFLYGISFVAKKIAQPSLTEWIITCFILFVGSIIPTGFVLSALDLTANVFAWIAGNYVALALHYVIWSFLIPGKEGYSIRNVMANRGTSFKLWFRGAFAISENDFCIHVWYPRDHRGYQPDLGPFYCSQ